MHGTSFEFAKTTTNSNTSISAPHVSDYMDYRQYLASFFEYKRKQTASDLRPYNYAAFSAGANIKSPNYLKMIIEGRRNLSGEMVLKFAKALGLNKEATEDFNLLVSYGQATDPANRNMFLKELSEHRVQVKLKSGEIDQKTWDKIPNWAAWVIYAMVDQEGVSYDTKTLRELLRGKASEDEIEQALESLFKSGELAQDPETGKVRKAHTLIEAAEDIPVALVRKLQAQLMYLGLESLYQDAATEREFGTLTMSLTKQEFEEIKFKLRQIRKQINKDNSIARASSKGEKVYQLNIQLFPVTNATNKSAHVEKVSKEDASH
ncbi:MAG TPA: TIGR02147 family protein [Pseudobdellovibrionaceae bacterium]|jgi:uncharacterized protein (TIGR02147 family)